MKNKQEHIKGLLEEAVTLLCRNSLDYNLELSVQGLLGITLDQNEVFLVSIDQKLNNGNQSFDNAEDDVNKAENNVHMRSRKRKASHKLKYSNQSEKRNCFSSEDNNATEQSEVCKTVESSNNATTDSNIYPKSSISSLCSEPLKIKEEIDTYEHNENSCRLMNEEFVPDLPLDKDLLQNYSVWNDNMKAHMGETSDESSDRNIVNNKETSSRSDALEDEGESHKETELDSKSQGDILIQDFFHMSDSNWANEQIETLPLEKAKPKKLFHRKTFAPRKVETSKMLVAAGLKSNWPQQDSRASFKNASNYRKFPKRVSRGPQVIESRGKDIIVGFYMCPSCGEYFQSRPQLENHKRKHKPRKFICDKCSKSFNRADNYKRHMLNVHDITINHLNLLDMEGNQKNISDIGSHVN